MNINGEIFDCVSNYISTIGRKEENRTIYQTAGSNLFIVANGNTSSTLPNESIPKKDKKAYFLIDGKVIYWTRISKISKILAHYGDRNTISLTKLENGTVYGRIYGENKGELEALFRQFYNRIKDEQSLQYIKT